IQPQQLLERRIADVVAATLPDVLAQLDGRLVSIAGGSRRLHVDEDDASIRFHNLGLLRRVLHTVANPTLAYLLVVGGALALLFEAFQPGFGVAGATGAVLAALGLYGLSVLAVNWTAFGLVVAGLVLLAADLALGRLGALTAGGALALTVGSALLFDRSGLLRVSPWLVAAVVAGCLVFVVVVMTTVLRAQAGPPAADAEALVGKVGVVRSVLNPQGHVFVAGALWRARAPDAVTPVRTGTRVRVVGCQEPPTLDVELADESSVVA
ncbi:MAG TPA: NfeD family protein, partial [Egibacteraceae bacterium]|nr:NfeD family protein [Egibacteraceae bacterium]